MHVYQTEVVKRLSFDSESNNFCQLITHKIKNDINIKRLGKAQKTNHGMVTLWEHFKSFDQVLCICQVASPLLAEVQDL